MTSYKVCPNCGRQNPVDAQWCASCGNNITNVAPPQQAQPQPAPYGQGQYQPAPGYQPGQSGARQQIISSVQMRVQTDEVMPIWWIVLPLVGVLALVGFAAITIFWSGWGWIGIVVGLLLFLVLYAVLVYKLVTRQNEHIKREIVLRTAIINYVREKAREQYKEQMVAGQISTMESINQEASYKEQENNALLFTIMSFIPILNLYVLYVLTKFPFEHDSRWHTFTQQAQYALSQVGVNIMTPSWKTLPRRSFWLYLIITLIIGVFMIYWLYTLIDDPNDHYQAQWAFEDQLMSQLR
ncbi:MAG: hypothetical protein A4E32_00359 [Methanomassiliicoccales archaeon PtaU1.Bin124]|nr:MAG: hypothetical protein A4E32_00359 [Methanomassiliicoccales archaeon PtaU1.Bin124]